MRHVLMNSEPNVNEKPKPRKNNGTAHDVTDGVVANNGGYSIPNQQPNTIN